MKKSNAFLILLFLLLIFVGLFEIFLFSTYKMDLVDGIIEVFNPNKKDIFVDGNGLEIEPSTTAPSEEVSEANESIESKNNDFFEYNANTKGDGLDDNYIQVFNNTSPPNSSIESENNKDYSEYIPSENYTSNQSNKNGTVYITNTGSKYHSEWCQYLRGSKIPISLSAAKAQGYTPCKTCRHGW